MADHADDNFFDGDIFVYRGGRAPQHVHVTHARIDKSINEIEEDAFDECVHLLQVDTHDGLRKIGRMAFYYCDSLRRINLKSVVQIDEQAFYSCIRLESVEFGDRLETIGTSAFSGCPLKHLKLPSLITIGRLAFDDCRDLIDIELSERIEIIGALAFWGCDRLQRIAVPLKRDLFVYDTNNEEYNQFDDCHRLTTVDLVGGIHKTVASLHMELWTTEMIEEINRINKVLPIIHADDKTNEIIQWMDSVMDKMNHYKAEHLRYVKEGVTLLELALWKAKLDEKEGCECEEGRTKKAEVHVENARKDKRMICGADMVINNVLPFLQLE